MATLEEINQQPLLRILLCHPLRNDFLFCSPKDWLMTYQSKFHYFQHYCSTSLLMKEVLVAQLLVALSLNIYFCGIPPSPMFLQLHLYSQAHQAKVVSSHAEVASSPGIYPLSIVAASLVGEPELVLGSAIQVRTQTSPQQEREFLHQPRIQGSVNKTEISKTKRHPCFQSRKTPFHVWLPDKAHSMQYRAFRSPSQCPKRGCVEMP
mmetsp:Transcript_17712/g.26385  ORF Transcript_17712/g.26385 Transcript_17712/m.26385 type:complete len:207 (-) Transcript_17712:939-1559(-)